MTITSDILFPEGLDYLSMLVRRAETETSSFGSEIRTLPPLPAPAPKSRAREVFEFFSAGDTIEFEQVLLGLRAMGFRIDASEARAIFDEADRDGSGRLELEDFASLAERVELFRQGRTWSQDIERMAAAARTLHAQAIKQPLHLVRQPKNQIRSDQIRSDQICPIGSERNGSGRLARVRFDWLGWDGEGWGGMG